jgi:hypothetical protein
MNVPDGQEVVENAGVSSVEWREKQTKAIRFHGGDVEDHVKNTVSYSTTLRGRVLGSYATKLEVAGSIPDEVIFKFT